MTKIPEEILSPSNTVVALGGGTPESRARGSTTLRCGYYRMRDTTGTPGIFIVRTTGFPSPVLTVTGTLPTGVTFVDNGNGTATLASTAATPAAHLPADLHSRQRRDPQRHPALHSDRQLTAQTR